MAAWTQISGAAVKIAVDATGTPWVLNTQNQIYRYNGNGWTLVPGKATDIAIGGDGSIL